MRTKTPDPETPDAATPGPRTAARKPARTRKAPRKVSPQSLENAALYYLARFSAPSAHLRRVLFRRIERSIRVHSGDAATARQWVEDLVERFRRSGLLDDTAYAAGKARSLRRRGTSSAIIGRTLRAKGLSATETEAALAGLASEDGRSASETEFAAAARLAQRKRLGPFRPAAARAELRQRDMAALARAGFSYDVARRIVEAENADILEDLIRGGTIGEF
jgi:regulatory protein